MSIKTGPTSGTKIKKSVSINLSGTGIHYTSSKGSKTNIRSRQKIPEPTPPKTSADYLLKRSLSDVRKKDRLPPLKRDSFQDSQDRRTFQKGWPDDMYVDRQLQILRSPSPSLINAALIESGHMVKFSEETEEPKKKEKRHRKTSDSGSDGSDDSRDGDSSVSGKPKKHKRHKKSISSKIDEEDEHFDPNRPKSSKVKGRLKGKDEPDSSVDDGDEEHTGKRKKAAGKKGRPTESAGSDESDDGTEDGGKGKKSKETRGTDGLSSEGSISTRSDYSSVASTGDSSSEETTEGGEQRVKGKKRRGQIQFDGADERGRSGRRGTLQRGRNKRTGSQCDGSHKRRHRGRKKSSIKKPAEEEAKSAKFPGWDMGAVRMSGTSDHMPDEAESIQSLLRMFKRREYNRDEDKYRTPCSTDPVKAMHLYFAKHQLNDLIEYLFFVVAKEKPAHPLDFLIQLVGIIKHQQGIRRQASTEVRTNMQWYMYSNPLLTNQIAFSRAISTPRLIDSTPYLPSIQGSSGQKKGSDDTTSSLSFEPFPLRRTKYLLPGSPKMAVSLTNSEQVLPKKKDSNKKYSQP